MKAKEFEALKKLIKKAVDSPESIDVDDARDGVLLMEIAKLDVALKVFEDVLRREACERKYVYESDMGTVTVGEPMKQVVNEDDFKLNVPDRYKEIIDRKISNLHVILSDLSPEEKREYTHYEKATAKITVKLA